MKKFSQQAISLEKPLIGEHIVALLFKILSLTLSYLSLGLTNLVLDEQLDTLDGGGSSLGDSSGNTTH